MTNLNAIKFIGMNLKWKEIFMDQNCSFSLLKIIIIIIIIIVKCCVLGSTIKFNYNFFFFFFGKNCKSLLTEKIYTTDNEHASILRTSLR